MFLASVCIEARVGSIGDGDFFTEVSIDPASHHLNEFAEAADRSPYRPELRPQGMLVSLCWRQEVRDQGWKRLVFPEVP